MAPARQGKVSAAGVQSCEQPTLAGEHLADNVGVQLPNGDNKAVMLCRSWYFMFFQCPWLPEFMLTAADVALFDGCFRSGPIAPRNKGAVSNEDIERCALLLSHTSSFSALKLLAETRQACYCRAHNLHM